VIWLNPGSASQPRGGHAPSVAVIAIDGERLDASIIEVVP
jgi:predicted phosphodiesterase